MVTGYSFFLNEGNLRSEGYMEKIFHPFSRDKDGLFMRLASISRNLIPNEIIIIIHYKQTTTPTYFDSKMMASGARFPPKQYLNLVPK